MMIADSPRRNPVTKPVRLVTATKGSDVSYLANCVTSRFVPSAKLATTENCCFQAGDFRSRFSFGKTSIPVQAISSFLFWHPSEIQS